MTASPTASQSCATDGPLVADLEACVAAQLGARSASARVLRPQRGKPIFEFAVTITNGADVERRHCVGKVHRDDRGAASFDILARLRAAGFRPPRPFTVVCPIAYVAERRLLLQEPAPGRQLKEFLGDESGAGLGAVERTAGWLATLHAADIEGPARVEQVRTAMTGRARDLMERLPRQAPRVERLASRLGIALEPANLTPLVPSHGDFHSYNVFVAHERVTVIDLDMFGRQEQAADVGYFLAQAAIQGYLHLGSFAPTAKARHWFLRAYREAAPPVAGHRLALYAGMTFLQSLHYELCVLRTGNAAIVEPWLRNAERGVLEGEVSVA